MVLEQVDIDMQKEQIWNLHLTPYTKVNAKWIIDLNLRITTITLEGNRNKSLGLWMTHGFLAMTPKVQARKENR